uniref:Acyl-CoA dehydrogenase/oxidase C-terminal domain-containing protein n=1 Tax=Geospiza parvula TaxID=87175 RepID=A0A8C3MEC0_GEOPR
RLLKLVALLSWNVHSHLQTFPSENIVFVHSASIFCGLSHTPFSSGIHVAKKIDKLGMRSSDTAQIFFEDVRVPCKNLIGEEGNGFTYQMLQFQEERLWGVASALTLMETVIQETIDYTRQRKVFGRPVLHNQTVHFRLAELAAEVECNDVTKFASMAKLKMGRLTREVTDSCLQFWGGMGFTKEDSVFCLMVLWYLSQSRKKGGKIGTYQSVTFFSFLFVCL